MSGGEYVALAYGVVFVVVVAYVAIIAAKLQRLEREAEELVQRTRETAAGKDPDRRPEYASSVRAASAGEEDAS